MLDRLRKIGSPSAVTMATCAGCGKVQAPEERPLRSASNLTKSMTQSRLSKEYSDEEDGQGLGDAVAEQWRSLKTWVEELLHIPHLFRCSVCEANFCDDCAPVLFSDFRVCEPCSTKSHTAEAILQTIGGSNSAKASSRKKKDGGVRCLWSHGGVEEKADRENALWLHAGLMLSKGQMIRIKRDAKSYTTTDDDDDEVLTKADCIARYLELMPTTDHWCDLAAAMSWSEAVYIAVKSSSGIEIEHKLTAEDVFSIALTINSKNPSLWTALGDELPDGSKFHFAKVYALGTADSKRRAEAVYDKESCFIKAIEIKPDHYDAWASLGLYLAAKNIAEKRRGVAPEHLSKVVIKKALADTAKFGLPCLGKEAAGEDEAIPPRQYSVVTEDLAQSLVTSQFRARSKQNSSIIMDATQCIKKALELHPGCGVSWTALASILGDSGVVQDLYVYDGKMHRTHVDEVDQLEASIQAVWSEDSESAWFNLGVTLGNKHIIPKDHHPPMLAGISDREMVFRQMIKLHQAFPSRFPLELPKIRFALAVNCGSDPAYTKLDSRYLISDLQKGSKVTAATPITKRTFVLQANVQESERTVDVCWSNPSEPLLLGGGAEGLVLKAVELKEVDDGAGTREVHALLAAKVMPIDATKQSSLQDHLTNFGDLKYLLSDQFSDISIKVRHVRILRDENNKETALVVFMDRAFCTLAARLDPKKNGKLQIDFKKNTDGSVKKESDHRSSCVPPSKRRGSLFLDMRSRSESVTSTRSTLSPTPGGNKPFGCNTLLAEKEIQRYALALTSHLAKLHSKFVEHADIKPENLLLHENGVLLLTDFGLSFAWAGDKAGEEKGSGTGCYAPPAEDVPTTKVGTKDVWALGQTVRAMFVGVSNLDQQIYALDQVLDEIATARHPAGISAEAKAFLTACLQWKANDRATCVQLLSSDWLVRRHLTN